MCQLCCNCSSFVAVAACQDELLQQPVEQLRLRVKGRINAACKEHKENTHTHTHTRADTHTQCEFIANRRNQCGKGKARRDEATREREKENELGLQMNIKCRTKKAGCSTDKGGEGYWWGERIVNKMSVAFTVARRQFPSFPLPSPRNLFHFLLYIWISCRCAAPKPLSASLPLTLPLPLPSPLPLSLSLSASAAFSFFGDLQPLCYGPKWWWMRLGLVAKLATGTGTATGHAAFGSVAVAACACASATVATAFRLPWPGLMPAAMYNNNNNNDSCTQCQKKKITKCNSGNLESLLSERIVYIL